MRRLAALACAATLVVSGCTYAEREPGLFPTRVPTSTEPPPPPGGRFLPKPTNPNLPVAGEAIWVSGGRLPVTFRFAVHAVRRIEGATVLDWSVTPLRARGLRVRRRPARHRPGALPRLPQRRQHRPARPRVRAGVPTAEPRVAAAVQPLPVHPTLGHPAGPADRGDPADADRVSPSCRPPGVRRRQPGHAGPVRARPGEPDRHRAGGPAAHRSGPVSRPPGRRHHTDRVPLSPTSRRAGRASRSTRSSRPPAEHRCSGPCGRSRTRTPPSSSRTGRRSPARRQTMSTC